MVWGEDLDYSPEKSSFEVKEVGEIDSIFYLSEKDMKLYDWISRYYHYSLGRLISDSFPKRLKRPRKIVEFKGTGERGVQLSEDQSSIFARICMHLGYFSQHLIHGVTGSGKSLIYLEVMKKILKEGQSVLFLLPEINLTPQFIKMFQEVLDVPIFQYHSSIQNSEKYFLWKKCQDENSPYVVVGVRSSLFLPMKNLGLIIVDEEHDASFKQEDRCPYHGRDVAIYKAMINNCPIILGSATPSCESFYRFYTQKLKGTFYYRIESRYGKGRFPKVYISSLKDFDGEFFTEKSLKFLDDCIGSGDQALIMVNRLGFSHYFQCRSCGHHYKCPNCSTNLKIYKKKNQILCHYCDYLTPIPRECEKCGGLSFEHRGFGTEQVQEKLEQIRPQFRVGRFDRDDVRNFKTLKKRLKDFTDGEYDLLIGTQMLSKGHNFEKVNLVLILGIDSQLNFPDFRANERVYQLVSQISGRAGRFSGKGKVVIETLGDENPLWSFSDKNSREFYQMELSIRELCRCSPFYRFALISISSRFLERMIQYIEEKKYIFDEIQGSIPDVLLDGPNPASIEKRVNRYTWIYLLRSQNLKNLHRFVESVERSFNTPHYLSVKIDIDPISF